jgi:hypothetical protein
VSVVAGEASVDGLVAALAGWFSGAATSAGGGSGSGERS